MNEITSSKKIFYRLLLVGFTGFFGWLTIICFNKYDSHNYAEAVGIVYAIISFLLALIGAAVYMSVKDITITATQATFKSFLGYKTTTSRLSDITSYTTYVIRNKYGADNEGLSLYTKDGETIKIKGNLYSNYEELKGALIKNAVHDEKLEAQLQNQNTQKVGLIMIAFGIIMVTGSFLSREKPINPKDIVYVKDMAADNIRLSKGRKGNSSTLHIDLMKYPDYDFRITGLGFDACDSEGALSEIRPMNVIMVGITKEEYDKKISKTVAPDFFDIYFGYSHINVYELKNQNYEYLAIANYNQVIKENKFFGMGVFSLIGLIFLVIGAYNCFRAQRKASELVK